MKRRQNGVSGGTKKRKNAAKGFTSDNFFAGEDSADGQDDDDDFNQLKHLAAEEDDGDGDDNNRDDDSEEEDNDTRETADEKRLRMAKEYLKSLELDKEDLTSDEEVEDAIAHRLQRDVLEEKGKLQSRIAHLLSNQDTVIQSARAYRGHKLSPTCLCVTSDDTTAITGAKDSSLIKWDIQTGAKHIFSRYHRKHGRGGKEDSDVHTKGIASVAVSDDGHLVASGGNDQDIKIWDLRSELCVCVQSFPQAHKGPITALAFRRNSREMFSGSTDRIIKVWNMANFSFVESLYGHQEEVMAIDSLYHSHAVSVGGDKTLRLWKVLDETQLMFTSNNASSIDTVSMVNEDTYLSGSQDGSLSLWRSKKKKPVSTYRNAHNRTWISSISALPFADVLASGGSDGYVKVWQVPEESVKDQKMKPLLSLPVTGYVNGLHVTSKGRTLIAAVGQEHRLGRWNRIREAQNGLQIFQLRPGEADNGSEDDDDDDNDDNNDDDNEDDDDDNDLDAVEDEDEEEEEEEEEHHQDAYTGTGAVGNGIEEDDDDDDDDDDEGDEGDEGEDEGDDDDVKNALPGDDDGDDANEDDGDDMSGDDVAALRGRRKTLRNKQANNEHANMNEDEDEESDGDDNGSTRKTRNSRSTQKPKNTTKKNAVRGNTRSLRARK